MKKYKKSKYNIIVPYKDDECIVFNAFSGSIGKFDAETMRKYYSDSFSKDELDVLIAKKIYIPAFINEIDYINRDRAEGIFSTDKSFRIWPTSACNARCYYCFEQGIHFENMTNEIADSLIVFMSSLISDCDRVSIEWFGGEPLINVAIIDYISIRLSNLFAKRKIKWRASIISNGSLITDEIVKKCINEWNIKSIQITLDGFREDYNRIKNYINPAQYNFDNVIINIRKLIENGVRVSIRMNYDTGNYGSLKKLILFLRDEFKNAQNISFYVYPIWNALGGNENSFVTNSKADQQLLDLMETLVINGMATTKSLARLRYRKHQCLACGINNYTILPNGDITKCCEAFNSVIGNVYNGIVDEETAGKWTDIGIDDDCKTCVILPLCQGGCRASRVTDMPRCIAFKEVIPDLLRWYVSHEEMHESVSYD